MKNQLKHGDFRGQAVGVDLGPNGDRFPIWPFMMPPPPGSFPLRCGPGFSTRSAIEKGLEISRPLPVQEKKRKFWNHTPSPCVKRQAFMENLS